MKTKEELNALRNELEVLNQKLAELTGEELEQVTGGIAPGRIYWKSYPGKTTGKASSDEGSNGAN